MRFFRRFSCPFAKRPWAAEQRILSVLQQLCQQCFQFFSADRIYGFTPSNNGLQIFERFFKVVIGRFIKAKACTIPAGSRFWDRFYSN